MRNIYIFKLHSHPIDISLYSHALVPFTTICILKNTWQLQFQIQILLFLIVLRLKDYYLKNLNTFKHICRKSNIYKMNSNNIFESVSCFDTPSYKEKTSNYLSGTPISPIAYSLFAMDDKTPSNESEYNSPPASKSPDSISTGIECEGLIIEQYIDLLKSGSDVVKFEAASSLLHALSHDNAITVVALGGLSYLVQSLATNQNDVRDECAKCIMKIIGFSSYLRDAVMKQDGLIALLKCLDQSTTEQSRKTFLDTISVFSSFSVHPDLSVVIPGIPGIINLMKPESDESVIIETCKVVSYLCANVASCVKIFLQCGLKSNLMLLLSHRNEEVVTSALRTLRSLVPLNDPAALGQVCQESKSDLHEESVQQEIENISTLSEELNDSCSEQENDDKEWLISPLTNAICRTIQEKMYEKDLIACQNIEMFKATEDDTVDRATEAGAVIIGQVGIRCIHCGVSPFARAQFSTVYPGSVGSLAASLRHMKDTHFRACERTPIEIMQRLAHLSHTDMMHKEDNTCFKNACFDLCNRVGIINRYPPRSGLLVNEGNPNSVCLNKRQTQVKDVLIHPLSRTLLNDLQGSSDTRELEHDVKYSSTSLPMKRQAETRETLSNVSQVRVQKSIPFQTPSKKQEEYQLRPNFPWTGQLPTHPSIEYDKTSEWENPISKNSHKDPNASNPEKASFDNFSQAKHCDGKGAPTSKGREDKGNTKDIQVLVEEKDFREIHSDLVLYEDRELLTDFTFYVICKFKLCYFSEEADGKRRGFSEKSESTFSFAEGFPGIQCVYCTEAKNPRKFYFSKCGRLNNSFFEVAAHLLKCKCCPAIVKSKMNSLKLLRRHQMNYLPRGSQAIFFRRLWTRLHGETSQRLENCLKAVDFCKQELALVPYPKSNELNENYVHQSEYPERNVLLLASPDDRNWLSEAECWTRLNMEIFSATETDVMKWNSVTPARKIVVNQVGFRCSNCTTANVTTTGYTSNFYPTSISKISETVREFHEKHVPLCRFIPSELKSQLSSTKLTMPFKMVRDYYRDCAKKLGMFDGRECVFIQQRYTNIEEAPTFGLPPPPLLSSISEEKEKNTFEVQPLVYQAQLEACFEPPAAPVTPSLSGIKRTHDNMTKDYESNSQLSDASFKRVQL